MQDIFLGVCCATGHPVATKMCLDHPYECCRCCELLGLLHITLQMD